MEATARLFQTPHHGTRSTVGTLHSNTYSERLTSNFGLRLEFLEAIIRESECRSEAGCVSVLATKIRLPNLKGNQCPPRVYVQFHITHPFLPFHFLSTSLPTPDRSF